MVDSGRERSFLAGMLKFAVDGQGQRSASFYIMNTSRNRNRWGVTDKALEEALPTLKGKPIGMGAGYKIDKHYADGQTLDSNRRLFRLAGKGMPHLRGEGSGNLYARVQVLLPSHLSSEERELFEKLARTRRVESFLYR